MAAVYGFMKQYASHCAFSAAGTSTASFCLIVDTAILAVSIFVFRLLGQ